MLLDLVSLYTRNLVFPCEGEIKEYFIGEDMAEGDAVWEDVSLSTQQVRNFITSLGTHTFIR